MQERRVGHSGLRVSRLALGTMSFGAAVDELVGQEQLTTFLEAGGTLVDTAPIYGDGHAESMLGALLGKLGLRDQIVLAGKAGLGRSRRAGADGEVVRDASRGTLLDQLDQSLRDLGTDHLDLWQVHRWDDETPIEETLAALEHAVTTGRVRYVGISNYSGWQTATAAAGLASRPVGIPLVSTQVEYSLLKRDPEREVVPAAEHHGLGLLAWSPLGRGVLTGKYRGGTPGDSRGADQRWEGFVSPYLARSRSGIVEAVVRAADGLGVAPSHVALTWLRDRPQVASAVVGARTTDQLRESLGSEQLEIPPEILAALDYVSSPSGQES